MKKFVYIIIALWIFIIGFMVIRNEYILKNGVEVLLETVPVDPRDLFRGDYVTLSYKISRLPVQYKVFENNETVYAVIRTNKQNVASAFYYTKYKPENELFIKGTVRNKSEVVYGIESYFVKENTGKNLERELSDGAYAKVVIDKNGNAKIKSLVY